MEGASPRSPRRARLLHLQTERLMDDFFGAGQRPVPAQPRTWEPRADVYETDDSVVIQVELSAIARESISLALERRRLVLRGDRCVAVGESHVHYHQVEIPCGTFERVFQLPPQVATDHIEAKLKDGLLTITLSKMT